MGVSCLSGATAQASAPPAEEAAPAEEIIDGLEVTLKLDLGTIQLMNVEPTQGRTAHMSFDLHLMFDPQTDPQVIKELEHWQHRLREQAIVAVRATEIHDFLDPELKRFRRQILYRINRLLKATIVTDALFANFTFSNQ
ncbi:MAG: hypothetical protein SH868_09770 [Bythopirellula sp.]|nr:hypothetical protein [Bythopirellula sp.]